MLDLLGTDEMDVGVQSPGRDDAALARDDLRRGANDHADAILDKRISGMSDPDDATVLDADVAFDDALNGVKNERVRNDQIQGFRVGGKRRLTHSVANDLAAAKFHFAAISAILRDQVALDFNEELRVGQANLVADRRAEHFGIEGARQFHGESELSVYPSVEAVDLAAPCEGNEFDLAGVSRFEAHGGSRRNAQTKSARRLAVKIERAVGFVKVEMASYLDRAIAPIGDDDLPHLQADIGFMRLSVGCQDDFSGDHRIGL